LQFVEGTRHLRTGGSEAGFVNSPNKFVKQFVSNGSGGGSLEWGDYVGWNRFTWDWGSNKKPGWRSNNLVALMDESVWLVPRERYAYGRSTNHGIKGTQ